MPKQGYFGFRESARLDSKSRYPQSCSKVHLQSPKLASGKALLCAQTHPASVTHLLQEALIMTDCAQH